MNLRVYVRPSGRRIQPFDDPVSEVPLRNRPLADWQEEMFRDAGLIRTAALEPPSLVVPDTLFSTGPALTRFLELAGGRDAVLVLGRSEFGRATTPVQPGVTPVEEGWRFEDVRFVSGRGDEPVDVVVDPEEILRKFELPSAYVQNESDSQIAMPRYPVMTLHHWVHILWANQFVGLVELRNTPRWKLGVRGLWAAFRALSFDRWKVMARCSRIGKGCRIHPSAIIEVSTLEDGVTVGANARILASHVAAGALIGSGARVEACAIGERSYVAENACLRLCVLYPRAVAGHWLMQRCVLGRNAITMLGGEAFDLNLEKPIRVVLDGELHSTGCHFLGSAFGHDSRMGTGIYLAAGREIPNGYFLIRDPDAVIRVIPQGLAGHGSLVNDHGTVRPLHPGRPRSETDAPRTLES